MGEIQDFVLQGKEGRQLVLLGMPVNSCAYFKGKLLLRRVIAGTVECIGYEIAEDDQDARDLKVFSPKGYSLLRFQSLFNERSCATSRKIDKKHLQQFELNDDELVSEISRLGIRSDPKQMTWMIVERLDVPWTKVLDDYLPYCGQSMKFNPFKRDQILSPPGSKRQVFVSEMAEKSLNVNFYESEESLVQQGLRIRLYRPNPDWESSVQSVKYCLKNNRQPRIVVAGGKGVGKSTFVRYLTNRLLKDHGAVLVLDLDPGQAEFAVPGCISCVKIHQPLLGPNFCHLNLEKACCINLGDVNISNIVSRYSRNVGRLIKFCENSKDMKNIPWIINTMGFNRGLGVEFMQQILSKIRPSTIVEIRSRFEKKNFELNFENHHQKEPFNVLVYEAMPESLGAKDMGSKDLWGIPEPARLRDICILSYLGGLYNYATNLLNAKPFKVSWERICIQNLGQETFQSWDIPQVINMSFVSIGCARNFVPQTEENLRQISGEAEVDVFGFGFVRGVDKRKRIIFVVSPLTAEEINGANCISFGAVILPTGVIASQPPDFPRKPGAAGTKVPYQGQISKSSLNPLATPWQRYSKPKGQ